MPRTELPPNITGLIESHDEGCSLERDFYCSDEVFGADINSVFRETWLLVDHVSRIPNRGDYFLFEIANESIIIIRENENQVNALFNVCRHRGSLVCLEAEGNKRFLTCPYHAWSYNLDGALRPPRLMADDFDATNYGLHTCHCVVYNGLIFICLSEDPPDFETEFDCFDEILKFHGMDDAKIAVKRNYPTTANWKLVVENFLECYHCAPAHPEYCSVHPQIQLLALGAGPGSGPPGAMEEYQPIWDAWKARAEELGHPLPDVSKGIDSIHLSELARFPVSSEEFQSETKTGQPACRLLMGQFNDYDGGETAMVFSPVGVILASNDFAMMVRFTPRSPEKTDVQMSWLVHQDAVEGDDYDPDNVCWLWDVTTKQDSTITENNQAGVRSSRYQPGRYSEHEAQVVSFQKWYLNTISTQLSR